MSQDPSLPDPSIEPPSFGRVAEVGPPRRERYRRLATTLREWEAEDEAARGPLGWAKERAGWNTAVDVLCSLALSLLGGRYREPIERARKKLKGSRKQTLGVVIDAVEVSMETGTPIWRDAKLWGPIALMAAQFVPGMKELFPAGSWPWIALGLLAVLAHGLVVRAGMEGQLVKRAVAMAEREATDARTREHVEERRLEHERRQPLAAHATNFTITSTDGPVNR